MKVLNKRSSLLIFLMLEMLISLYSLLNQIFNNESWKHKKWSEYLIITSIKRNRFESLYVKIKEIILYVKCHFRYDKQLSSFNYKTGLWTFLLLR